MSSSVSKRAVRQALLLCTTTNILPEDREKLSRLLSDGINWEQLLDMADFHGIITLVAHNLNTSNFRDFIPEAYFDRLNRVYNSTLYKNVLLSNELTNVLAAFNKHGIDTIALKGTVLAEIIYKNPALRAIGDIDILVHPRDIPQSRSLLNRLGYQQMPASPHWEHHFHEVPYYKQATYLILLELHWDLEDRRLVTIPEEEIWRRSQLFELNGIPTMVLSPEDNLLFLSTHLSKQTDTLLKFLGDIAELLKKYQDTLDWDYIVTSARSWQTDVTVYYAMRRAKDLLGAPVPALSLEALKPSPWRRFILDLLVGHEDFIAPSRANQIREWTYVLAQGLMMKHPRQTLIVLSRQEGLHKKMAWLRIVFWTAIVLAAAIWRNGARTIFK
jgi:hypothetical protein